MSRKITITEVKKIFSDFNLSVLDIESHGVDYKYTCQDEFGYLYSRSVHSLQRSKIYGKYNFNHVFSTKNKYFYENMQHYMKNNVRSNTILLTQKENIQSIKQALLFKCGNCGKEYYLPWHNFVKSQEKICKFCFNRKKSLGDINSRHNDTNKFHCCALKSGMTILSGPNIKYHNKVVVQDKNGYKGVMMPSSILNNSKFEKFSIRNPYTLDNIRIFALHNDWDCVIYEQEYKGDKVPFKVMCSCGNDFLVDINHFIKGKYQCNECRVKQSAISKKVEMWLLNNNIAYEKEKTFSDCINTQVLPFDFYLVKYNACIEVDGIGHYRPVAFSGDKQKAQSDFALRQHNDFIKNEYCNKNKISLLRLPFWEIESNNFINILSHFIYSLDNNTIK